MAGRGAGELIVAVEFNIGRSGFSIRPAVAADAKAVRMLLPEMRDAAVIFVAVDGEHQLIIGAAVAARVFRQQPLRGQALRCESLNHAGVMAFGGVYWSILNRPRGPRARRRCMLQNGSNRAARSIKAGSGWASRPVKPSRSMCFRSRKLSRAWGRSSIACAAMGESRRMPASFPCIRPTWRPFCSCISTTWAAIAPNLYRKLRGHGPGAYLPRQSRVLLIDNQVKGCLLAHRASKETITVDANIVEPSLRGGWANAWLKLEAFRGAPAGVHRVSVYVVRSLRGHAQLHQKARRLHRADDGADDATACSNRLIRSAIGR